ncbi:MAG: VCBS repeat-containing protein [Planctomycetes bacterium]|nr:VCBS repeat-containing protein [Planctomycetota bacterium]
MASASGKMAWKMGAAIVAAVLSSGAAARAAVPRDEHFDIVATDRDGLWVFLGNGDGTFGAGDFYYIASEIECWHVIAPDLDGDDRSDIVSADRYGEGISVLMSRGDGTFDGPTRVTIGEQPYALDAADFDGDGVIDLVLADRSDGVWVLWGIGNGTFDDPEYYPATDETYGVTHGDFDGDGMPDLAIVGNASQRVAILLNDGGRDFEFFNLYTAGTGPKTPCAAYLDEDDVLDLAVTNWDSADVSILLGNGDGSFRLAGAYGAAGQPRDIAARDLDEDGDTDLVIAGDRGSSIVTVLRNDGEGSFDDRTDYVTGPRPHSICLADFDEDEIPDFAAANWSLDDPNLASVSVNFGDGTGVFGPSSYVVPLGGFLKVTAVAAGSFNPPILRRGEANGDGRINISDAVTALAYMFDEKPVGCLDALDVDDDGRVTIGDPIYLLSFLFADGAAIMPPYPGEGRDPTPDGLSCLDG